MSSPLKSFEGPDVQQLLDRIRREVGADATISAAEKIRVGGLFGFFAKEHYRVLVEIPTTPAGPAPIGRNRQPAHARTTRRSRRRAAAGTPAPAAAAFGTDSGEPTAEIPAVAARQPDIFTTLADATDDVTDIAGVHLAPRAATATTPAPSAWVTAEAPVAGARTAVPVGAGPGLSAGGGAEGVGGGDSFDAVLCRIATTLDATAPIDDGSPVPAGAGPLETGPVVAGAAPPGGTLASEAALFLAANDPGSGDPRVDALRRTGLADAVVGYVADGVRRGGDLEALLLEALGRLAGAPPLPQRAGSLLVVVGEGPRARELAAAVAVDVGTDPAAMPFASLDPEADTVVPGPLLVRSAEEAAELAPGWRRSPTAAVVVVDAALTGGQLTWASHVISAMRPTAVWGVVDSTFKPEDVAAWAGALGGVDALALENIDATVSPAAALRTGIPVVRIDGRPASAARWTATIVDRMGPCT